MLIFSAIGFLLVFATLVTANCPGFEDIHVDPTASVPNPALEFSADKQLRHSIITFQDNDTILINRTKIFEMKLDCWASYPVDFTFSGHMTNQQAMVKTHVSKFTNSKGTPGHCYRINVTLLAYEEITGNYSCFKVSNPLKRSSKYIFVYSTPPEVLLRRGQNVTLIVEPNQKSVILPCAISDPDVEVQLLVADGNRVLPSENLKFNPKIGYEMKLGDTLGEYKCQTSVSEKDYVNIKLIRPHVFNVEPKMHWIRLKRGDHLKLKCMHAVDEIYIELKPTQSLPEILINKSEVLNFTGKTASSFYKYSTTLKTDKFETSPITGSAICKTKYNHSVVYEWSFTLVNDTKKDGLLDLNYLHNYCPRTATDKTKQIVLYECNNVIECNINRCLKNEPTCQNNNKAFAKCGNKWECFPNGLIQCVTPTGAITEMFFTGFNKNVSIQYTNGMNAPVEDVLRIQLAKESPMKSSKKFKTSNIRFVCEGSAFVIAGGFQWSLGLSNGKMIDVHANDKCDNGLCVKETWGKTKSIVMSTLTIDVQSPTFNKAENVICLAPIWNSTKWINQTYNIGTEMKQKFLFANVTTSKGNAFTSSLMGIISTLLSSSAFLSVIQHM